MDVRTLLVYMCFNARSYNHFTSRLMVKNGFTRFVSVSSEFLKSDNTEVLL